MRIALAFKEFVIHEDIQSFLCVLNKHPRSGDNALDKNTLSDIFNLFPWRMAGKDMIKGERPYFWMARSMMAKE